MPPISLGVSPHPSLDRATTGTGDTTALHGDAQNLTAYVMGVGAITAGKLVIEESYDDAFTGTWCQIGMEIDLTTLSGGGASPGGKQLAIHANGCFWNVRARITTSLTGTGGAVTVVLLGS